MIAQDALKVLAGLVANELPAGLDPQGRLDMVNVDRRRNATAQTLNQLISWTPQELELDLAELGAAYEACSYGSRADQAIRNRQITCQQFRALCRQQDGEPAQSAYSRAYERAIPVWKAWIARCDSSDPRQAAMRTTFERELGRLQAELASF